MAKKVKLVALIATVALAVTCVFPKWAEKGLASPAYEEVSPNKKFKVVVYNAAKLHITDSLVESFGKLYDYETGKFIAESEIVVSEGAGGLHWGRFGEDYRVYFGMEVLFDLGAYDTKYNSFTK
ncbi:hypothetical protein [Spartinivicinus ruber]|uniref:hypothetical protein n=1 Tax=Spartinivicinus ruber TaxID=2683272 RepID=UPI0013D36E75|nr:hypothetical protein [Spartinivicinus ruber]